MMQCVIINNPGPQSTLQTLTRPLPVAGENQLLIEVHATALNRADLLQRQGKYPPPPGESDIPGLEVAGIVINTGSANSRFKKGDAVYGLTGSGTYASHCLLQETLAEKIPAPLTFITAAALPEALVTAHATLFERGHLQAHEVFLIHAASSGLSTLAIQMAALAGARVITTASTPEKMQHAKTRGAQQVINRNSADFTKVLDPDSIDVIVDFLGAEAFNAHLTLLKPKGRLIQIASMQGARAECNLALLIRKRLKVEGFVLRAQTLAEKTQLWAQAQARWGKAIDNGALYPVIDSVYRLEDIEKAHARMQSGNHCGKIVIQCR